MSEVIKVGGQNIYLTFRVGKQWYAVDVQAVFEVYNLVAISEVADMPESILGVVNIRGSIVPVLDLRIRFNMPNRELELSTPIIFLSHTETKTYGIVVDDVDDVINIADEAINPTTLNQRAKHIRGLSDHKGRLIMIIDPVLLMTSTLNEEMSFDDLMNQIQAPS